MRIPIMVAALVLFGVTGTSGQHVKDDPWNPEHINHLPAEVRATVLAKCPTVPTAGHYFVTYFHDQINLHFENFHCGTAGSLFCKGSQCLHQVYKLTDGHYRLVKSFYGSGND